MVSRFFKNLTVILKHFIWWLVEYIAEFLIFVMQKTMKPLLLIFICEMIYVYFIW